jgi:hypothetical protein
MAGITTLNMSGDLTISAGNVNVADTYGVHAGSGYRLADRSGTYLRIGTSGGNWTHAEYYVNTNHTFGISGSGGRLSITSTTTSTGNNLEVTGTSLLTAAVTASSTMTVADNMAIGGAILDYNALTVTGAIMSGATSNNGLVVDVTGISAATNFLRGAYFRVSTAVAAYAVNEMNVIEAAEPTVGAGSSITTLRGVMINAAGGAVATHKHGLVVEAIVGGVTTNRAIQTGNTGNVLFGYLAGTGSRYVNVDANGILGATSSTFPSTATQGDLLYASAANVWSNLALGTTLQVLSVNAGATQVEWAAVTGTGSVMRAVSPTTTGTLTGAAANWSGQHNFKSTVWVVDSDNDILDNNPIAPFEQRRGSVGMLAAFGVSGNDVSAAGPGAIYMFWDVVNGASINSAYGVSGSGGLLFNEKGYSAGGSQFRDFTVRDGKGGDVFTLTGSSKFANFGGSMDAAGQVRVSGKLGTSTVFSTGDRTAPNTSVAIDMRNTDLTSAAQSGIVSNISFNSSALNSGYSAYFGYSTAAAAFTMPVGVGVRVYAPVIGAGSAVTNNYGIYIENQTGGGTNWAILTAGGQHAFSGNVRIGSTTAPTVALDVTGAALASSSIGVRVSASVNAFHVVGTNQAIATSGSAEDGSIRMGAAGTGMVCDFGINSALPVSWIQSRDGGSYATNYKLALNPNGGKVGIGISDPSATLHIEESSSATLRLYDKSTSYWEHTATTDYTINRGGSVYLTIASTGAITAAGATTITGLLTANGGIALGAGDNIALATSTGTKIGTGTTQLLGFWNATPVDQPAHIADPTGGLVIDAESRTAIAAINAMLAETGLTAAA